MAVKTRFAELSYEKQGNGNWRIIALETGAAVGPQYPTRMELLADLPRYAADYGCAEAR